MKVHYIELLGEKHPLCFSLAASEAIGERFGSMKAMYEALGSKNLQELAGAVDGALSILMHEGRIYASALGKELPQPLPASPAHFIALGDTEPTKKILDVIRDNSARTIEAAPKKTDATQGI